MWVCVIGVIGVIPYSMNKDVYFNPWNYREKLQYITAKEHKACFKTIE
jgi:hypothetical protein